MVVVAGCQEGRRKGGRVENVERKRRDRVGLRTRSKIMTEVIREAISSLPRNDAFSSCAAPRKVYSLGSPLTGIALDIDCR